MKIFLSLPILLGCVRLINCENLFPIIGLFAQPSSNTDPDCGGNCQYIAASYVKYLEAAGARVVPIDYYATTSELDPLFSKLNVLLILFYVLF